MTRSDRLFPTGGGGGGAAAAAAPAAPAAPATLLTCSLCGWEGKSLAMHQAKALQCRLSLPGPLGETGRNTTVYRHACKKLDEVYGRGAAVAVLALPKVEMDREYNNLERALALQHCGDDGCCGACNDGSMRFTASDSTSDGGIDAIRAKMMRSLRTFICKLRDADCTDVHAFDLFQEWPEIWLVAFCASLPECRAGGGAEKNARLNFVILLEHGARRATLRKAQAAAAATATATAMGAGTCWDEPRALFGKYRSYACRFKGCNKVSQKDELCTGYHSIYLEADLLPEDLPWKVAAAAAAAVAAAAQAAMGAGTCWDEPRTRLGLGLGFACRFIGCGSASLKDELCYSHRGIYLKAEMLPASLPWKVAAATAALAPAPAPAPAPAALL